MKVGESEVMGTIDDDGIGIGNINTVLNYSCGEEYVVIVVRKVENNLFKIFRFHLSMTDGDAGVRDILMNHFCNMCQIADAVVHEIDLSIARHLEINGIGNNLRTEGMDLSLDGISVRRRCLNDAEVTGTDK